LKKDKQFHLEKHQKPLQFERKTKWMVLVKKTQKNIKSMLTNAIRNGKIKQERLQIHKAIRKQSTKRNQTSIK